MKLLLGLCLGMAFGAVLQLSGASSHTKVVGALRLKDLTIVKLILVAIGVGLLGVHALDAVGFAKMKVKDLFVPGVAVAGLLFGIGFAVTGYCPGTALAAAAEGKLDAWFTVGGGLFGALTFAFLYPDLEALLFSLGRFGPITLHEALGVPGLAVALPMSAFCLWLARTLPSNNGSEAGLYGGRP